MEGFIVLDYAKQYPEARRELAQWLSEGKIKRKETIVRGGLVRAEQALVDLYKGFNTGKPSTPVAETVRIKPLGFYFDISSGKLLVEVCPEDETLKANL